MEELNEKTDEWYEYMRYQHLGGYDLFGSDDEVRELRLAMGDATAADAAEKEENMSTGNLAVTGTFVDGGMLSAADRAAMIVLENDAYSQFAKLTATETLTDVRIYTLEMDFEAGSDDIYFHGTEKSSIPKLAAGQSIYLQLSFPGDTPHHGISFVDANGTPRCFSMMMSGFDGSLALSEEEAFT